jgi:hypothetical protein
VFQSPQACPFLRPIAISGFFLHCGLALGRDCGRPVEFLEVDGNVSREQTAHWNRRSGNTFPICARCVPISSAITTTAAKSAA